MVVVELSLAEHSHDVKNNFIWSFTFILQRWRLQMNFTHHKVSWTGCESDHPQFWSVYFDTSAFLSNKHLLILKHYKVNVFQSSFLKKKDNWILLAQPNCTCTEKKIVMEVWEWCSGSNSAKVKASYEKLNLMYFKYWL